MNDGPEFLSVAQVLAIHALQIKRYGGAAGVRDRALLESAVAAPQATFDGEFLHSGLFDMAAAYAFHISQNQPFIDGNKRTGLLVALVFLDLNGISISATSPGLYDMMIALAEGRATKDDLAAFLRELAKRNAE